MSNFINMPPHYRLKKEEGKTLPLSC